MAYALSRQGVLKDQLPDQPECYRGRYHHGPEGYSATMTVDGVKTAIGARTTAAKSY